ncbi:hypothetical protein Pflav_013070 [Phytohabitans flavus]|uniref:Uncharacterized protein n=1 Tax=Phytohabitans flavus TaxID=1076124 RepID=A0A6F8XM63_9ACTN|nr:hypothetical protein [Phytohabitans flavus]BCB74897.1 hypothetical protein Pflav_013070 [Phytohabitans flavus]
MGLDVIGVAVPAVFVVGDDNVGPVLLHQRGEAGSGVGHRDVGKRLWVVVRLPAGHARVAISQQLHMIDAEVAG